MGVAGTRGGNGTVHGGVTHGTKGGVKTGYYTPCTPCTLFSERSLDVFRDLSTRAAAEAHRMVKLCHLAGIVKPCGRGRKLTLRPWAAAIALTLHSARMTNR